MTPERVKVSVFQKKADPTGPAFESFVKLWGFWSPIEIITKLQNFEYRLHALQSREPGGEWLGAAISLLSASGADLVHIYVAPTHRGKGYGRRLLEALTEDVLREANCIEKVIVLEVARSNIHAQRLYTNFDMKIVGCRKGYYKSGDDALVFRKELKPNLSSKASEALKP